MSPMRLIILMARQLRPSLQRFLCGAWMQPQTVTQTVTEQQTVLQTTEVSEMHVLVAKRDLLVGDLLSPDDFEWAAWPEANVISGYRTEENDADAINELPAAWFAFRLR